MQQSPGQSEKSCQEAISPKQSQWIVAAVALGLITLAIYWPSLSSDFVSLDDFQYVVDNTAVRQGGLSEIAMFFREVTKPSTVEGYYQPLTMVSYMLDAHFAGESGLDSFPYHLTNILWHAGTAILVMLLARFVVGGVAIPFLIGIIFALHPVQVESVAWISQRKTVLASFFAVASVLSYLHYGRSKRRSLLITSLLLYCIAGLAKPTVMLLPLVFPLLDWWPLRRPVLRGLIEKLPHFAVMLVMAWVAWVSQATTAALMRPSFGSFELIGKWFGLISFNLMQYLGNVFLPLWLSPYRDIPSPLSYTNPQVLFSVIGVVALLLMLIVAIRKSRPLFVGAVAFAIILLPALGGVRFTGSCVADRFLYLPFVFLLLSLAAFFDYMLRQRPQREPAVVRGLVLVAVVLLLLTIPQQRVWSNSKNLWTRAAETVPTLAKAHANLAYEAVQIEDYDEALRQLDLALGTDPDNANAIYVRGMILSREGKPAEGLRLIEHAISLGLGPIDRAAHQARAEALLIMGDDKGASEAVQKVIEMGRTPENVYKGMADVAMRFAKRYDVAEIYCRKAIKEDPDAMTIRWNLGTSLRYMQRNEEALREYERVVAETRQLGYEPPPFMLAAVADLKRVLAQNTVSTGSTP